MDLKNLLLLLENKLKNKDYVLPYNSNSTDASTIQNLNQELTAEELEHIIIEIVNKNVKTFLLKDDNTVDTVDMGVESLKNENNDTSQQPITSLNQWAEIGGPTTVTTVSDNDNNLNGLIGNKKINYLSATTHFLKNKNLLLFNFLMFSNENVINYVKTFSQSTDLLTITSSYKELINFLGYYKISTLFLDGVDEFSTILSYFKNDLKLSYYAFLHNQFESNFSEILQSNKQIGQLEYKTVVENLEKSQQDFTNENEKILDKSNNQFDNLISQKRNRKIILSGLLLLGSYAILAKTGIPFFQLTKLLCSSTGFGLGNSPVLQGLEGAPDFKTFSENNNSDFTKVEKGIIRFRDIYDLSLKVLYKKLISIVENGKN